ncbi:MAG: hypothetical protein IKE43_03895 [Coriobacteriales bacterium]|nr:hypothetical protein [Coriobacteriales bacterium]
MSQVLIRNVDEATKQAIAAEAKKKGWSVQAELLSTIKQHYMPQTNSIIDILLEAGKVEGDDFVIPSREPGRDFSFE